MPHIVITGNPVDGFTYHGPFGDIGEAAVWAEENAPEDGAWWVAELQTPEAGQ